MKRWLIAVCACASEPEPPVPPPPPPAAQVKIAAPRPAALTHVTIKALGMYCEESCPMRVRYALADMPADLRARLRPDEGEHLRVVRRPSSAPAKEVTKPMLVAIKQAGFDPWLAKEVVAGRTPTRPW